MIEKIGMRVLVAPICLCLLATGPAGGDPLSSARKPLPAAKKVPAPRAQYTLNTYRHVLSHYSRGENVSSGYQCRACVVQDRSGYIKRIEVTNCPSGRMSNRILDALVKSSPLPQPDDPSVFEEELCFQFR